MRFQDLLLATAAVLLLGCGIVVAAERPNLLIIITDDHGYGDVSTYHESDVRTPNIDGLAREGMLFTSMRANCTVCSPSRAALLTGKYPDRVGVPGVIRTQPENSWGYFDPQTRTLADELKSAGYHTGIVGKWHLGLESPNLPNERGFEHFHGFLGDMMDSYTTHLRHGKNYLRHNAEPIEAAGHATDLFTDWAISYLQERAQANEPFFLYLAYNAPHFPIEPPAEWLARVKERAPSFDERRAKNVAFVEHLDDRIGKVLRALKATGLANNTVVAFTSDNGGSLPHGQYNAPWRDGKQSHYDGGLRVPFMVRWPAKIKAGTKSDFVGLNFDLFPTFLELAGAKPAADLDAVSLVPVLSGGKIEKPRDLYFVRREGGLEYGGKSYEALIRGPWKLLQNNPFGPLELYNLASDPQEKNNVIAENKKVAQELNAALRLNVQRGGRVPWQAPTKPTGVVFSHDSKSIESAFQLVEAAVAKGEVPGAIALVSKNGKVVREAAYGLADVENKRPFTPETLCWIASITKPVTVAAAMKLVDEGKLGLDDPVAKYLPEFANLKDKDGNKHTITIRQLMSHTSGLQANPPTRPSFFFAQEFLGRKIGDIATAIADTPLQFTPGTKSQYSNAAPYVLGRVIELQAGKPFHEHVRQTILEPAGMRDSYFIIPQSAADRTAVVYRDTKDERVTFFRFDPEWEVTMTLPDGGLFSSPREVAKFLQVFLDNDGRVLSKSSVRAMLTQQTPGWGLGWGLEDDGLFQHNGSSGVAAWADPQTGVVGVLFCQLQNPDKLTPLQNRFREALRAAYRSP